MPEITCNTRDPGSIPGSGRSPGEGNGNPLQVSCPGNLKDSGAWQAIVHEVTKELDATWQSTSQITLYVWVWGPNSIIHPLHKLLLMCQSLNCALEIKLWTKRPGFHPYPSRVLGSWQGYQIWVRQNLQSHRHHSLQHFLNVQPPLSLNTQLVSGCWYRFCYVLQCGVKIHH